MFDRVAPLPPFAGWIALTGPPSAAPPARRVDPAVSASGTGADPDRRVPRDYGGSSDQAPSILPDPDRPTGPPPAFEANVLEAQAERRRDPSQPDLPAEIPPTSRPGPRLDVTI